MNLIKVFGALTVLVIARPASAEDPSREETAPSVQRGSARVRRPELKTFVDAKYPQLALDARVEGRVILELTISEHGNVTAVEVVEGLGYGLDEAATEAAREFVFVPARLDGTDKPARLRYAYDFRLPRPEPAATTAPVAHDVPEISTPDPLLPATPEAPAAAVRDVTVRGRRAEDELRRSAAAVTVVDLRRAKRESADLGEVLARVEGVNVQRMGGLGSVARFSLAGFDDNQIRFFIDGIPLEYQGFSLGLQNVPLTFSERVDVYKGVVPITLGADSLGGAFNLITDRGTLGTRAFASYQAGSFDTHRFAAGVRHLDDGSGLFVKAEGFYDTTANDYPVDVKVGTLSGEEIETTVHRFHDAYQAYGLNLEVGVVNRGFAERLLLKGFVNGYEKELQHNALMTLPHGEAHHGGISSGVTLRYEQHFGRGLRGSFVTGYVHERTKFVDDPSCSYGWYGQCRIASEGRGELRDAATDQAVWDNTGYARWNFSWALAQGHELVFALAPTFFTRHGHDHLRKETSNFNELKAQRDMFKWIDGIEYKLRLFDGRLENSLFLKRYLMASQSVEIYNDYIVTPRNAQEIYWGAGDGLRYAFSDFALAKISYEYAIRIPEPDELFGNTVQIIENLELLPERSHNVNLALLLTGLATPSGTYDGSLMGFFREAEQLILLIGRTDVFRYENAYEARIYGVEGAGKWRAPGDFFELGLNVTYQEYRNRSKDGSFSQFYGDRIPNKPYLFGNATARLLLEGVMTARDEIGLTWYSHYTHEFYRGWESVGSRYEQPVVPSQLVHTAVLSYLVRSQQRQELSFSAEVQNLTNAKAYDFYRVQKPGRSANFKASFTY